MEYSDLSHAFIENMNILSIVNVNGLIAYWLDEAYLDRNLEGTFLYNYQIAFFLKLILFVYFTSSCDELYIFHLY